MLNSSTISADNVLLICPETSYFINWLKAYAGFVAFNISIESTSSYSNSGLFLPNKFNSSKISALNSSFSLAIISISSKGSIIFSFLSLAEISISSTDSSTFSVFL